MKNSNQTQLLQAEINELRKFILKRIEEDILEQEKKEQQSTIHEVEIAIKGKELILDNMCY